MLIEEAIKGAVDQDHLYDVLMVLEILAESLCLVCLFARRVNRCFPMLALYLTVAFAGDSLGTWFYLTSSTTSQWRVFLVVTLVEYCLELGVMWELITLLWKEALPVITWRGKMVAFWGTLLMFSCVAISSTGAVMYRRVSPGLNAYMQFDLGFGMFRALVFISIILVVQVCGVRWNSLASHVVASLALFSIVDFFCQIAHELFARLTPQYSHFDAIESVRICAWIVTVLLVSLHVSRKDSVNVQRAS